MSIYLRIPIGSEIHNIKELLYILYSNHGYANFTYRDKGLTILQCYGLRRSFEDLLEICQTYFPSTTEEDLMKELLDSTYLKWSKCGDINKIVFYEFGFNEIDVESFKKYVDLYDRYSKDTYKLETLVKIAEKVEHNRKGVKQ